MSAPGGAPSPAPRTGSMGSGAGGSMPPQQQMATTPVGAPTPGPPPPPPSGAMSQQNLNQIVSVCISARSTAEFEFMHPAWPVRGVCRLFLYISLSNI
jgi:transcription initiation factor TFIID subunit 5